MNGNLSIYNSLTRKKEKFEPLTPPFVGLYVCGPTVYNDVHLGNVRTFTNFDMVYRYLVFCGYKVRYVRNITDAGHLTNERGEGVNRIESQSQLEKLEPMEVVQKYTIGFHDVCRLFNMLPPTIEPTATGHILEQIEMAKDLIEKGMAYEINGSVYFDVEAYNKKYGNYGKLSGRNVDELIAGYRDLDGQEEKRNSIDFALWKAASPQHIMRWKSPWGEGFPGWHLECSVMSTKYLGATFDIHGGGMDLKFPHHECEIAQNVGSCGKDPVRYWMHSNMLNFEGQKMSKSLGNSILPMEMVTGSHPLLDKAYTPMTVRLLFLSSHYSSEIDITIKGLQDAEKGLNKLHNAATYLNQIIPGKTVNPELDLEINDQLEECRAHMDDDFNTAKLIANLYGLTGYINTFHHQGNVADGIREATLNRLKHLFQAYVFDVLGLELETLGGKGAAALKGVMNLVLDIRKTAKEKKDFGTADQIRDALNELKINIKDGKDGSSWELN